MNIFGRAHKATVSLGNNAKTSKERLVSRAASIKVALEGGMPEPKRTNLKKELRGILSELDARAEAVEKIMAQF